MDISNSPIVFARKPLEENTVVDNVLKWGAGAINIDESRIELNGDYKSKANGRPSLTGLDDGYDGSKANIADTIGRFPANLILDTAAAKVLDEQSGISKSTGGRIEKKTGWGEFGGSGQKEIIDGQPGFGDTGGASRYFYQPKGGEDYENTDKKENTMKLLLGDCLDKLKELEDNSVDSIVTDPPYGLSFMGKQWDYDVPSVDIWKECLRVLKPGGHLLAFAGSRTYHRMAVRIEDAGFEIRDMISWLYGSGFPKSMDISKQIDKKFGKLDEREVVGIKQNTYDGSVRNTDNHRAPTENASYDGWGLNDSPHNTPQTSPATDEAKQWSGWGTALKPAHEPVVMARKPLSEKTVADNVLEWGTGGINIDGCRIETDDNLGGGATNGSVLSVEGFDRPWMHDEKKMKEFSDKMKEKVEHAQTLGRFPANIIFDEEAGKILDEQSGISRSFKSKEDYSGIQGSQTIFKGTYGKNTGQLYDDRGGASRFFYCPKTSKSDRNEGLGDTTSFYELADNVNEDIKNQIKSILKLK